ncbi:hypothetical protein PGTUg99_015424 [Puccinia graminis f. sp. tritici]|uniref:Uncharacterized protein n=1 Tax=Puccinia graminis f. sp. tritici TaxID=56615 RepID=A0A5B0RTV5_PUCGR|nr:hypothetical protein PGTUg99_015424 [Puccinia graminis f. sp. tritici]
MAEDTDTPGTQDLLDKADSVIHGFRRLSEYGEYGPTSSSTGVSIKDPLRSKEDLFTELHSSLLPLLKQHIDSLSQALKSPDKLRQDPVPILELILEIQPKLAQNLDQISHAVNHIIPVGGPEPNPATDQDLKEFKAYRLRGLANSMQKRLKQSIGSLFHDSRLMIQGLQLPRERSPASIGYPSYELNCSIDRAIRWSKASELNLLSGHWQEALGKMNEALGDLLFVVNPDNQEISRPVAQLAQAFIPLLRLINLFFKKILKLALTKERVQLFTGMSTEKLVLFENLAEDIAEVIFGLVCRLEENDTEDPLTTSHYLIREVKSLYPLFQSVLLLLNLYIVPLFPDSSPSSSPVYFKSWLVIWYTLFFQATNNTIKASQLFEQNHV